MRIDALQIDRHFHVSFGATLRLRSLTLVNRQNPGWGGWIRNRGALSLERMVLVNNAAGNRGGTIYNRGAILAVDTVFSRNRTVESSPQGGQYSAKQAATLPFAQHFSPLMVPVLGLPLELRERPASKTSISMETKSRPSVVA